MKTGVVFGRILVAGCLLHLTSGQACERLKRSLTYTQEEAPRDLSGVLPVVVARVNQVLEGVVNVEVGYHGDDLQGRVGEHLVKCEVTRLASVLPEDVKSQAFVDDMGRQVVSQCFEVPFTILDTNECTLPLHHALRHQCQAPAVCVNTNGSYDCVCPRMTADDDNSAAAAAATPNAGTTVDDKFWANLQAEDRGPWEVSYNTSSRTTCPSSPSTHDCCPERPNTREAMNCRRAFHCPSSPCVATSSSPAKNECASSAKCVRKSTPNNHNNYECKCPDGLMGNGHKCRPGIDPTPEPKVRFDGVTPTEETIKNNFYCDCTAPTVDACSGFPPCTGKHEICTVTASNVPKCGCKPGHVMHEKYGCVDEKPPLMKLRNDPNGDQTLRLKQGQIYKEDAVDIQDENAEEYMRSLKIAYSRPLPHGCLTKVGEFHVNYTIATPWTSPAFVRLTRRVIIEDIDECTLNVAKYQNECPQLIPKCDVAAGATCVNKVGTYSCDCPKFTSGDGFQSGLSFNANDAPAGFAGGTGCRDTSKPVIQLKGPNPKVFRIAQCGVLAGIMHSKQDDRDADLRLAQQKYYGDDIKAMIRQTAGAELCATHDFVRPNASDCVKAFDDTYKGRVDLSKDVTVGDPIQTSMLHWRVPYSVADAAGNKAETVWRDVVVEEVDLSDVEARVRRESSQNKNEEIRRAVDKALADERKRSGRRNAAGTPKVDCPKCPTCDCSSSSSFDPSMCDAICQRQQLTTCQAAAVGGPEEQSSAVQLVLWLESLVPPPLVTTIIMLSAMFAVYVVLSTLWRLQFGSPRYAPVYNAAEREQGLQNHITVFSPQPEQNGDLQHNQAQAPAPIGGFGQPTNQAQQQQQPQQQQQSHGPPTASASLYGASGGGSGGVFSPSPRSWGAPSTGAFQSPPTNGDQQAPIDIYERSPIITPSRRGDGVQRAPYRR